MVQEVGQGRGSLGGVYGGGVTGASSANIVLIGLRGSGKTTLGRALSARLGLGFCDLDRDTPALLGFESVASAWSAGGERAFREAEAEVLRRRLESRGMVLALGGGTPTAPGAAELLRAKRRSGEARVVYLRYGADELRRRLGDVADPDRPSLTGDDPLREIEAVLAARDPLYRELAEAVVETGSGAGVEETVELVCSALGL